MGSTEKRSELSQPAILLVAVDYKPNPGGVSEYIHALADALHRQGKDVIVLAPRLAGSEVHDASVAYEVRRFDFQYESMNRTQRFLAACRPVVQAIKAFEPKVILLPNYKAAWALPWMAALLMTRRRYWAVAYGLEVNRRQIGRAARLKRFCFFRQAKGVVAISKYTAQKVAQLGVKRMFTIPCGIDPASLLSTEGVAGSVPILLTVGRLVERKGHDMMIRALPAILEKFPDTLYVIAGDGPDRTRLEHLATDMGVGANVRFDGSVSETTKWQLYQQCQIFCMPSRELANGDYEGFGIVYLEAALAERPVIAGRCGGAVDAVADGETGLLVDPESLDAIAAAVIRLLGAAGQRERMGQRGRERALAEFSWDGVASRFLEMWEAESRNGEAEMGKQKAEMGKQKVEMGKQKVESRK